MKKVLLYSGGMDSWIIDKLWKPDVKLYVDVGASYAKEEMKRLPADVVVEKLDLSKFERSDKILPLRNLYFVMLATNYGNEICLGATYGDRVLDKSEEFAAKAGELLSYLYQPQHWTEGREIKVNVDFKQYTKAELLCLYLEQGGNLQDAFLNSFSCYAPDSSGHECWHCKPCIRKAIAFLLNGYRIEDQRILSSVSAYLEGLLPSIHEGSYGRGREGAEMLKAYEIIQGELPK